MTTTENNFRDEITRELNDKLEPNLLPLLEKRDGAALLAQALPGTYAPEKIVEGSSECRAWELAGIYYLRQRRPHEALPLFSALYDHMLAGQGSGKRIHKGLPLIWIYECYLMMGFVALPKRYLMLTLIEDAISEKGKVSSESGGTYFRLVWRHGLADSEF